MLKSLKHMLGGAKTAYALPPGERVYAVGDIHGRADLLDTLLDFIKDDVRADPPEQGRGHLVFLGDYVDRGPYSREVVERLLSPPIPELSTVYLKGNHEETLLNFLDDSKIGPRWGDYGGFDTLESYGVALPSFSSGWDVWERIRDAFEDAIPATHLAFYQALKSYHVIGDYFFVHAGVDPRKPFEAQTDRDFLWVRHDFLEDDRRLPFRVVHGHTPEDEPFVDDRRIGLDTYAYSSGVLTAARLDDGEAVFLKT